MQKIAAWVMGLVLTVANVGGVDAGEHRTRILTKSLAQVNATAQAKSGQVGLASFYAKHFQGRYTASGQRYDKEGFTAAHPSLPFGTKLKVTNLRNKRSVVVTVNDRGAFAAHGRIIDLSRAAARELGMIRRGIAKVKLDVLGR